MKLYKKLLQTYAQREVMSRHVDEINAAIKTFGGDAKPKMWYWSRDEVDGSYAYVVNMHVGGVLNGLKAEKYMVRPISVLRAEDCEQK